MRDFRGGRLVARIGSRLEGVLLNRGLTVGDLALMAGVNDSVLSSAVAGRQHDEFGFDELEALADALGVDVIDFLVPLTSCGDASEEN